MGNCAGAELQDQKPQHNLLLESIEIIFYPFAFSFAFLASCGWHYLGLQYYEHLKYLQANTANLVIG